MITCSPAVSPPRTTTASPATGSVALEQGWQRDDNPTHATDAATGVMHCGRPVRKDDAKTCTLDHEREALL